MEPTTVRRGAATRRAYPDPLCYIIVHGHELPEFETVVESGDGYDVVQNRDATAAALAEETDPRS